MDYFFWILIGLIIGWVIEWVIDWLFWRKPAGASPEKLAEVEAENRRLQAQLAECQQRSAQLEAENSQRPTLGERSMPSRSMHMTDLDATIAHTRPVQKDRLEVIEGIGPVYAKRLNDAGIFFYLGVVCFSVSLCETVDDAEFFILPKAYEELFCSRVVNPNSNKSKIMLLEDLLNG